MQIPRLHPDTIEEVKQRADIVDVISTHVVLRKRGKDFVGLCPFHDEKSPSFTVSPSKQMFYCFGCGAGGNAFKFLMELGKRSFSDVVLELARQHQVPVQTLEPEQRQELQRQISLREQLYEILALASSFYEHALRQSQGQKALEYLQVERKLSEETIQQFQLGYAPSGWEALYSYLVEQKHYPLQLVEQAGLILPRKSGGNGYYDRFRDRLMIPICDLQGRVIAFGGRTLTDEQPKYLNSPETELFDKGKTLYALDKAKTAISKQDRAVVVEGYFDAIALHAAGISNAVASLGTALSLDQVRQLLRYTESKQIVLNFDADKAGTQAAERAIGEIGKLAYRGELQLRILNIPDGKDADEYLKTYSADQYSELLLNAPLWLDWQIQNLLLKYDLKQADHYSKVAQEMVKILTKITDDNQLNHYRFKCAEILGKGDDPKVKAIGESLLNQVTTYWTKQLSQDEYLAVPLLIRNKLKLSQQIKFTRSGSKNKSSKEAFLQLRERSVLEQPEAFLLRIYIHSPEHRQAVIEAIEARGLQFSLSHHRFLWLQILNLKRLDKNSLQESSSVLISKLQSTYLEFPKQLEQISHLFNLDEISEKHICRVPLVIRATIAYIEQITTQKRRVAALNMWKKTDAIAHREEADRYYQQFWSEQEWIKELERLRRVNFYDLVSVPWIV
ncbi:DNA primase [Kamptonema animale CS-326]|jgi:DNA primase|uniref:DNA primase n=1 Tax=Kamptonema animale TaxID=92934 RepID=UPI00232A7CD6|nr:DNA primase [Kamptonema animale]MDB9513972.1 DNA primase [Kamptonema animale CS-326]